MDRRAFFLLGTRGRERVLELSCEELYMRWADARNMAARGAPDASSGAGAEPWTGEPPTDIDAETTDALLADLDRELADADVLRVRDRQWLADPGFRADVESRIEAFRARGGRVE